MSLADTIRDIANENALTKTARDNLNLIAEQVDEIMAQHDKLLVACKEGLAECERSWLQAQKIDGNNAGLPEKIQLIQTTIDDCEDTNES